MCVVSATCIQYGRDFLLQSERRAARHFFRVLCRMVGFIVSPSDFRPPELRLTREEWTHIQKSQLWATLHLREDKEAARLCSGYAIAGATRLPWLAQRREELRWLRAGLLAARQLSDVDAQGVHLDNLGYAYARRGNFRRAVVLFWSALDRFRRLRNHQAEFQTLCDLGGVYRDLGNSDESMHFYKEALYVGRQILDTADQVQALLHIGNVYNEQNDLDLAIGAFNEAYIIATDHNDSFMANYAVRSVFKLLNSTSYDPSYIGEFQIVQEGQSQRDEILKFIKWENKLSDLPANPALRGGYANRRRSGYRHLSELFEHFGWWRE